MDAFALYFCSLRALVQKVWQKQNFGAYYIVASKIGKNSKYLAHRLPTIYFHLTSLGLKDMAKISF